MFRKRVLVLAVVVVALGILAVVVTPLVYAGGGREKQITDVVAAFEKAYLAGDVDRLVEMYADDAVSMPPGFPASVGKAGVREGFEYFYETFTVESREFKIVDIWISGNLAARRGEWSQTLTFNDGSGSVIETGKCVLGFKKTGNDWKVIWDLWNYDQEPEVVPAP